MGKMNLRLWHEENMMRDQIALLLFQLVPSKHSKYVAILPHGQSAHLSVETYL